MKTLTALSETVGYAAPEMFYKEFKDRQGISAKKFVQQKYGV